MKYRSPTDLVEGFISKLTAMKDVGKMSDAYRQKVGIDKLLGSMDKSQQKLKKFIDGSGDGQDKFVNCFNSNDCWVSAFNEFNSLTGTLADIENSLGSLENSIKSVEQQLADLKNAAGKNGTNRADKNGTSRTGNNGSSRAGSGSDWSENGTSGLVGGDETEKDIRDDLKRELDSLKKERGQLDNTRRDTINKLNDLWNRIRNPLTSDFIKSNKAAMDEISKIAQKGEKAQLLIAELEKFLDDNFSDGEGEFSKGFKEQINTELSEIKELILKDKSCSDDGENLRQHIDS